PHPPRMVRADEVVGREDASGPEQGSEEDEVEDEEGREPEALQEARGPARPTSTRKYDSTQPLSRRWSSRAIRRESTPVSSSGRRAMPMHGKTNQRMLPP